MDDELIRKRLINNAYKVLAVYEDCEKENDFSGFDRTLATTVNILKGHLKLQYDALIYDGLCLLKALEDKDERNHEDVKYAVMLCINRIKK